MAQFATRCNEKHVREIKMKDLNPRLLFLQASMIGGEFNGEYNSDNCIIIELAFLELGKVLLSHAL